MVSYLERTVDDTESLVTFICSDAEHLPAALKLRLQQLYIKTYTTMCDESVSHYLDSPPETEGFNLAEGTIKTHMTAK